MTERRDAAHLAAMTKLQPRAPRRRKPSWPRPGRSLPPCARPAAPASARVPWSTTSACARPTRKSATDGLAPAGQGRGGACRDDRLGGRLHQERPVRRGLPAEGLRGSTPCCWSGSPSSAPSTRRISCRPSRTRRCFRASRSSRDCSSATRSLRNGCSGRSHHVLVRLQHAAPRRDDPAVDHAAGARRLRRERGRRAGLLLRHRARSSAARREQHGRRAPSAASTRPPRRKGAARS